MNSQSWSKPKQEIPRSGQISESGVVWFFTWHNGISDTHALLFQAIEQPPRPDELRCQNAERKHDGKPARPGRRDHHDSQREQREPDQYFDVPLGLLERMDQHQGSRFTRIACARGRLIGRLVIGCGSSNNVSACTPISIAKAQRTRHFQIHARQAVGLHQPSARAATSLVKRLPHMEKFCRESGRTGPHAYASQSNTLQSACAESDDSASIRICTRYPRKLSG